MGTGVDPGDRKERRRAEVRARLRRALQDLAGDQPFRDIKVADITTKAGLSRSAFYFYYDDKRDLLIEAVKQISTETFELSTGYFERDNEPQEVVREVLRTNAEAWNRHADLLRLAIEASIYDEQVQKFWRELIEAFIEAVAVRMRADQAKGLVAKEIDVDTCAEVLVTATEGFFYRQISRRVLTAEQAVEALEPIWLRLLYV